MTDDGLIEAGWPSVSNEPPDWSNMVEAKWIPPTIDLGRFLGNLVFLVILVVLAIRFWLDRGGPGPLVLLALTVPFLWEVVQHFPGRRSSQEMTLVLGPEELRLASTAPSSLTVVLPRDRAGWLEATEVATNWHMRYLVLTDSVGRVVASLHGSLASVAVRGEQEEASPPLRFLASEMPVAVLLGAWWPNPARRVSRRGSWSARSPWREPDLAGFVRYERRERAMWTAMYGVFAALLALGAASESSHPAIRVGCAVGAVALVSWRISVMRWRPRVPEVVDQP